MHIEARIRRRVSRAFNHNFFRSRGSLHTYHICIHKNLLPMPTSWHTLQCNARSACKEWVPECQSPRLHVTMCVACSLSFPYLYKEGRRRLDIEGVGEYNGAMSPPERRHELLSWFWSSCQVVPSVMWHCTNCIIANLMQPNIQNTWQENVPLS